MRLRALVACLAVAAFAANGVLAESPRGAAADIEARPDPAHATLAAAPKPGLNTLPGMPWAKVYIPAGYSPERPAPMALMLHGSGDRGQTMIRAFQELADEHGVILLAPDALDYSWDIMVAGAHLRGTTRVPQWGPDVDRIDAALKQAFGAYAVDPERISLIGFSDGAGYGLSLGTNNADLFGTVIAFAPGLLMRVEGEGRGRVMLVHGDRDEVLSVKPTREIFKPVLEQLGFDVELRLFRGGHVMPDELRREAFNWWLDGAGRATSSAGGTAR
jgi:phospholipase/carboxylesterase